MRPARRRTEAAVDCQAILSYILRRCDRGCAPDYFIAVADNFFDNTEFPPEVKKRVLALLQKRLGRQQQQQEESPPVVNGSVVCKKCGRLVDVHPIDLYQPHLVVLCTGQRVRVSA